MLISDVLATKGHTVVRIHPTDSVELAVRQLAEHAWNTRDPQRVALAYTSRWRNRAEFLSRRSRNQTG